MSPDYDSPPGFDPYAYLGVSPDTPSDEIREVIARRKRLLSGDSLATYMALPPAEAERQRALLAQAEALLAAGPVSGRAQASGAGPWAKAPQRSLFQIAGDQTSPRDTANALDAPPGAPPSALPRRPDSHPAPASNPERSGPAPGSAPSRGRAVGPPAAADASVTQPLPTVADTWDDSSQPTDVLVLCRKSRSWSLEDLHQRTRISVSNLTALETMDAAKLPATVYVKGYLQLLERTFKLEKYGLAKKYLAQLAARRSG